MKDYWGRIWIIAIFIAIVGLSSFLWWKGRQIVEPARETYLLAEAQRLLGCSPYILNKGIIIDQNDNGIPEYLFSCDSTLSESHQRFVWIEVEHKKVQVLLHHTEQGWQVGGGTIQGPFSWLIDRRKGRLLLVPEEEGTATEPIELIWDPEQKCLRLGEQ